MAKTKNWIIGLFCDRWPRFLELAYRDAARPVEWISMLVMAGFAIEFLNHPAIVDRPTYSSFASLGALPWACFLLAAAAFQGLAIFSTKTWQDDLRFFALLIGLAFFVAVTIAFASSGISTTATRTYAVISLSCFFSGVFVLWNSNS